MHVQYMGSLAGYRSEKCRRRKVEFATLLVENLAQGRSFKMANRQHASCGRDYHCVPDINNALSEACEQGYGNRWA